MTRIPHLCALLCCFLPLGLWAAGPETVAKADRTLWPDKLDSPALFDRASRAELLVFAQALHTLAIQDEDTLKATLRIKSVDGASLLRVRDRLGARLVENYRAASGSCGSTEPFCMAQAQADTLPALAQAGAQLEIRLPAAYRPWLDNAKAFHRQYAGELLRLAALFPKVSSEIDTFSPEERTGFEVADRHFQLTFDDGPSHRGGHTDTLLDTLKKHQIHGMFYMLGERLKARSDSEPAESLRQRFAGQCVALHGWQHQSHQKWEGWQASVADTRQLAQHIFQDAYRPYFRPPYGQRRADSAGFFAQQQVQVALWNIDSQDWHAKMSDTDTAQRVMSLMLLWRRGVILFHDIHPKANRAVPWLLAAFKHSGIHWDSCTQY